MLIIGFQGLETSPTSVEDAQSSCSLLYDCGAEHAGDLLSPYDLSTLVLEIRSISSCIAHRPIERT